MTIPETIEERIFECIRKFDFTLAADVIKSWELTNEEANTPDGLRQVAIEGLSQAYTELIHPDDECLLVQRGRLHCTCYKNDENEINFQLDFVLISVISEDFTT